MCQECNNLGYLAYSDLDEKPLFCQCEKGKQAEELHNRVNEETEIYFTPGE
jgi:hypothetical protein